MDIFETRQELYGVRCPVCHKVGSIAMEQTHQNYGLSCSTYRTYSFKCTDCGFEAFEGDKNSPLSNIKEVLKSCDTKIS